MRRFLVAAGACAALSGCALPVPIQVASWAADIISVVATDKSLTDHGLSAITDKDCALHRAVTEDDNVVCREVDDSADTVQVADVGGAAAPKALSGKGRAINGAPAIEAVEAAVAKAPAVTEVAAFETAAAPAGEQTVVVRVDLAALAPKAEAQNRPYVKLAALAADAGGPQADIVAQRPRAGFYYVIGSFRGSDRAKAHMDTYGALLPAVIQGRIGKDGREVFRVVVGPFQEQERKVAFRRIKHAGIADTWAIRVTPEDWRVAAKARPVQQADAGTLSARDWPGLASFMVSSR